MQSKTYLNVDGKYLYIRVFSDRYDGGIKATSILYKSKDEVKAQFEAVLLQTEKLRESGIKQGVNEEKLKSVRRFDETAAEILNWDYLYSNSTTIETRLIKTEKKLVGDVPADIPPPTVKPPLPKG